MMKILEDIQVIKVSCNQTKMIVELVVEVTGSFILGDAVSTDWLGDVFRILG